MFFVVAEECFITGGNVCARVCLWTRGQQRVLTAIFIDRVEQGAKLLVARSAAGLPYQQVQLSSQGKNSGSTQTWKGYHRRESRAETVEPKLGPCIEARESGLLCRLSASLESYEESCKVATLVRCSAMLSGVQRLKHNQTKQVVPTDRISRLCVY
jgi:hypothetical protein